MSESRTLLLGEDDFGEIQGGADDGAKVVVTRETILGLMVVHEEDSPSGMDLRIITALEPYAELTVLIAIRDALVACNLDDFAHDWPGLGEW